MKSRSPLLEHLPHSIAERRSRHRHRLRFRREDGTF
jgi:hypothetical protein